MECNNRTKIVNFFLFLTWKRWRDLLLKLIIIKKVQYTGWVKKVWLAASHAKLCLLCATLMCVFFDIFWKIFATLMVNKNPRNQKFRKPKMCINIISIKCLDFIKIESQNHRKFAMFSSGLIFKAKMFFKSSSSFLLSLFQSYKFTLFSWKLRSHWKWNFP